MSAPTRVPAGHGVLSGRYTTFAHQEPDFGLTDQSSPTRAGRVDPDAEKAYRDLAQAVAVRDAAYRTVNAKAYAAVAALIHQEYPTATAVCLEWNIGWHRPWFDEGGITDAEGTELWSGSDDDSEQLAARIDLFVSRMDFSSHDFGWECIPIPAVTPTSNRKRHRR